MPDSFEMDDEPVLGQQPQPTPPSRIPPEVVGQGADEEALHRAPSSLALQRHAGRNGQFPAQPSRVLPSSEEAETHVLACCLIEGSDTLQRATDAGLTPRDFYFPENALIFDALLACQPPELSLLADVLTHRKQLDQVGGFPKLMAITSGIPTTAHAAHFIARVRELSEKRTLIRNATSLVEQAYAGEDLQYLRTLASSLTPATTASSAETLRDLLSRRVTISSPPKEPVTRLFLAGKPIATPGNIQTMTAKAKAGKTAAIGGAVASVVAAMTGTTSLRDTIKFSAPNPKGHAVIVIDTEQSPYDAWTCYQRILKRAGEETDPPWLLHLALVGYSVAKRKAALKAVLEYARNVFGGIFMVIIDGVAHFVSSVNELEECNTLADWLRELSVTYDTAMLCVIHSNEGIKTGDDSRGHLGKQLMRDAESNLLLKKDGEVTTITSEKQRKAPITENDNVAFRWSDEHGRHVTCTGSDLPSKSKGGRPPAATFESLEAIWPRTADKALTKLQLLNYAKDEDEISEATLRRVIKAAVQNGQLVKLPSPLGSKYHLPV